VCGGFISICQSNLRNHAFVARNNWFTGFHKGILLKLLQYCYFPAGKTSKLTHTYTHTHTDIHTPTLPSFTMDSKTYAYLDRYAKLQPYSNFLLYAANHPFTPLSLRRKRVLSFLLKKLLKCCYSATSDCPIVEQALQIINYLLLTFDAET